MAGRVAGKTALVSGAATGIGRSIAARLAAEGSRVAVADIDEAKGAEAVEAIREAGGEAMFLSLDVTDEAAWQAAIGTTESEFGRLNILVNNAGIAIIESVDKMSFKDWRAVMAVNIDGVFLGTKHAVPAMRRAGGGSIVNISSILGLTGEEKLSAYCASKGAVRLFTKAVAHLPNVEVTIFEGLVVRMAQNVGANVIVRGLRSGADFEYEYDMAFMNRKLAPDIDMVSFMTSQEYMFISSSLLKEVAKLGGDIASMVPPHVAEAVRAKFG